MSALLVALGGGAGAALRYGVAQRLDGRWPRGTLLVNTVASLLLGVFVARAADGASYALVATGFCGGLSTYSALAVQVRDLGGPRGAAYGLATVALGLGACAIGFTVAG